MLCLRVPNTRNHIEKFSSIIDLSVLNIPIILLYLWYFPLLMRKDKSINSLLIASSGSKEELQGIGKAFNRGQMSSINLPQIRSFCSFTPVGILWFCGYRLRDSLFQIVSNFKGIFFIM